MTFCTSDWLCALCKCPAESLLLLEEEVCLVWGQAAEVSPHREAEPQLSGRAQARLSEGQQLTVGTLLAVCKAAHRGLKSKLQTLSEPSYPCLSPTTTHILVYLNWRWCESFIPVALTCTTLPFCPSWEPDWLKGWLMCWPVDFKALVTFPDTAPLIFAGLLSDLCISSGDGCSTGVCLFTCGADKNRMRLQCVTWTSH